MDLGIVTIQRNRGKWLEEWFAFHYLMGFRKFYYYAHLCTDQTHEKLIRLARHIEIHPIAINNTPERVQLVAYQDACNKFMDDVDWMCFLDGDEFIFPTTSNSMQEALREFEADNISALGVFNYNFGSSGHVNDPDGLVIEDYRMRANDDFLSNRRVKSLVKGHRKVNTTQTSHLFETTHGTVDEQLRPISWGYMPQYVPSYDKLRLNHYAAQSREFYLSFKRDSLLADASTAGRRDDDWFSRFDTNDVHDASLVQYYDEVKKLLAQFRQ